MSRARTHRWNKQNVLYLHIPQLGWEVCVCGGDKVRKMHKLYEDPEGRMKCSKLTTETAPGVNNLDICSVEILTFSYRHVANSQTGIIYLLLQSPFDAGTCWLISLPSPSEVSLCYFRHSLPDIWYFASSSQTKRRFQIPLATNPDIKLVYFIDVTYLIFMSFWQEPALICA